MAPTLYFSPNRKEAKFFNTVNAARRAFTHAALKNERVVLIREAGLTFEVTINNPNEDTVTVMHVPNTKTLPALLNKIF